MAWIEFHTELRDHWKIQRLANILEIEYAHALGIMGCLWLWVAIYSPKGDISRFSDDEIRDACRNKNINLTKDTLKKCSLITEKEIINDWDKHGIKLLVSKRKSMKKYRQRISHRDTTVVHNRTVPNRTVPNLTNKNKGAERPLSEHFKDELFLKTYNEFLAMRKKLRKAPTPYAEKLILKDLDKHDVKVATQMLEESIQNSWVDVYPLKEKTTVSHGSDNGYDKNIETKLGRIATKDMIKNLMKEIPEGFWWKIDQFLKKRYPGGGNGFIEAEREIQKEKSNNLGNLGSLVKSIC